MKNVFETLSQVVFLIFAFILVVLISLGISFDLSRILTAEFWVEVSGQFVLTMITFNVVYYIDRKNKTHNTDSRFYKAFATFRLKVKQIEEQKLYAPLKQAVEDERKEKYIDKCNNIIYKYCSLICYDDIIATPIDELIKDIPLQKRKEKKLRKAVKKILSGKVRVKVINPTIFLCDKEVYASKKVAYDFNNAIVEIKRNSNKALTFALTSIILACVIFSFTSPNFLTALLKNITFIFSATVSGFSSSANNIKLRTSIYENRNRFLSRFLNLSAEYTENN